MLQIKDICFVSTWASIYIYIVLYCIYYNCEINRNVEKASHSAACQVTLMFHLHERMLIEIVCGTNGYEVKFIMHLLTHWNFSRSVQRCMPLNKLYLLSETSSMSTINFNMQKIIALRVLPSQAKIRDDNGPREVEMWHHGENVWPA